MQKHEFKALAELMLVLIKKNEIEELKKVLENIVNS